MRTAVVALGDSGHSRAERHALALARHGDVDFVCADSSARASLGGGRTRIRLHPVPAAADSPVGGDGRWRRAPVRAIANAYRASRLFVRLMRLPRPDVFLVQTPTVSTLPV